jgi:hypothetical protein
MKRAGHWLVAFGAVACSGDEETPGQDPVEVYACVHIAEGEITDVAPTREEARTIAVGRDPYRVNLYPGEAGYLGFETAGPAELVLQLDFAGAAAAVWSGEDRQPIEPGDPNPNCDGDIPEVDYLSVPAGQHWLELGPAYQGNVWLLLSEP